MNQNKNNKRFLKCFLASMVILIFIGTSLTAFITSCLADNNPNPYCTGDNEKIQELAEDFINKYGEGVEIRWNEDTGFLEKILYFNLSGPGDPQNRAFSFLSENSEFLGIDVNDLEFLSISSLEKVKYTQLYKGIPVHKGEMWVTVSKEGGAKSTVTLKDYYFCLDVDVVPTITKEEAGEIVMGNLGVTELFNTEENFVSDWSNSSYIPYGAVMQGPSPGVYPGIASPFPLLSPPPIIYPQSRKISEKKPASTQLLVYPKGDDAYLCWEFKFNQGEQAYTWYYYIDAHTGEIVYNYKGSNYISASSGTISGNSSYNSNISLTSGNSVGWFPETSFSPNFSISNSTLNILQYWPDVNYYSQPGGSTFRFYSPTTLLSSFNSYIPIGNGLYKYGEQLGYSQPFSYGIWNFDYPQYRLGDLANPSFVPRTETSFWTDYINTDVQRTIQGFFGKVYSWPQGKLLYGPPYM